MGKGEKKFFYILLAIVVIIGSSGYLSIKNHITNKVADEGQVFYEIFVRSFKDSDGDGIGDLKGVTMELDYLQDLGIKGIWLMPVQEATSYHGYDVEDYYQIEEDYGTLEDLQELITEAHKRDIKIVMDLVINHTSSSHPWFQEALKKEDSPYRDYYIWTQDMTKKQAFSPMGTIGWAKNPYKEELYYAMFWEGMPDLNYDNKKVEEEIMDAATFYLKMGVDGFRLDAAKWIYNEKEKNIAFWERFNEFVKSINKEAILIGEVWDKPYNCKEYAGPLDSFFDFEIGEKIIEGLKNESLSGILPRYLDNMKRYKEQSETFRLSPFLTNHDQNRVMSQLDGDLEKMKKAAALYLTLPGTPYIYYGEELGMTGKKPDENIREPFIWSSTDTGDNTSWLPSTNNIREISLDMQKEDETSLYNFYKNLLKLRNEKEAFQKGDARVIDSPKEVFAMERFTDKESVFVVINGGEEVEQVALEKGSYSILLIENQEMPTATKELKIEKELEILPGAIIILQKR